MFCPDFPSPASGAQPSQQPARGRVLIVEDDAPSARALKVILSRRGWSVDVAETLSAAMTALAGQPDVALVDLMLPDGDGESLLARVRQGGLKTRVIIVTATSDPDRLRRVHEMKADYFIRKPIDVGELLACLDRPN